MLFPNVGRNGEGKRAHGLWLKREVVRDARSGLRGEDGVQAGGYARERDGVV